MMFFFFNIEDDDGFIAGLPLCISLSISLALYFGVFT
jgi:hypothetical protein